PVLLPRIHNGHDKTFFFFDAEIGRTKTITPYPVTLFSNAERAGDFSSLPSNQWPIDPLTGLKFSDGRIPAGRVLPQSRRFIDELMVRAENGRSLAGLINEPYDTHQTTSRIDHQFSDRDALRVSLFENKRTDSSPDPALVQRIDRFREWSDSASIR